MPFPMFHQTIFTNDTIDKLLRMPQNFGSSLVQIEADIQRRFPGGVDAVVYGKSSVQGWSQVPNNKGIIAILIGIQSPRDVASEQATGKRQHKPYLKPGGTMGLFFDTYETGGQVYQKITWLP